jgi:hypothetical protein
VAAAIIFNPLNVMLANPGSEQYVNSRNAVAAADTVRDAIEGVGILGGQTERVVEEAQAVLDALPPAVDEAIIAALESAFERGLPVFLEWVEGAPGTVAVQVSEEAHRDDVRVRIAVVAPDGETFLT